MKNSLRPFLKNPQAGFSLIGILLIAGLGLIIYGATIGALGKRVDYLKIIRMQHRLELEEQKVVNAAQSMGSMLATARKLPKGHGLRECLLEGNCQASRSYRSYDLYNSGRVKLSGLKNLSGFPCDTNCPIEVATRYRIDCGGPRSCKIPASVETLYVVGQKSKDFFDGKSFKSRTDSAHLAAFVCEDNKYIVGITDDGIIQCDYARLAVQGMQCKPGESAYFVTPEGLIDCVKIENFCTEVVGATIVMDVSGSMKGQQKIDSAKRIASAFNQDLKAGDSSSFLSFNHKLKGESALSDDKAKANEEIRRQKASGRTNMTTGLENALKVFEKYNDGSEVLIFLSDGFHNTGPGPLETAQKIRDRGIRVFTIGFGKKPDKNILQQIATNPGDYSDATDSKALQKIFEKIKKIICRAS